MKKIGGGGGKGDSSIDMKQLTCTDILYLFPILIALYAYCQDHNLSFFMVP